jgi:Domain of unknown function (DUF4214)
MNDLQQIQRYFEYYCHRAPDVASLRTYAEHLERGTSLHTLHLAIAHSDEARSKTGQRRPGQAERVPDLDAHYAQALAATQAASEPGSPDAAMMAAPPAELPMSDGEVYLTYVYIALLGRRPDESGMQGYLGAVRNGMQLKEVAREIYLSNEALALNGTGDTARRIKRLQQLAHVKPLRSLCNGLVHAMIANEVQRLWQCRLATA